MVVPEQLAGPSPSRTDRLAAIQVDDLRLRYRGGSTNVLAGVNLRVEHGETVALIGTNGAGKSTLLRCLVRLAEPTSGTVTLAGTDVTAAPRRALRGIRRDIGFVFQRFHLIPDSAFSTT